MRDQQNVVDLRRARLEREIADRRRQLEQLEAVPDLDAFPNETVIRVRVGDRYGHNTLTYVLLKIVVEGSYPSKTETRWYFTGTLRDHSASTHWVRSDQLARWLTDENRTVESWELMLPEPATVHVCTQAYRVHVIDDTPPGEHEVRWNSQDSRWEL